MKTNITTTTMDSLSSLRTKIDSDDMSMCQVLDNLSDLFKPTGPHQPKKTIDAQNYPSEGLYRYRSVLSEINKNQHLPYRDKGVIGLDVAYHQLEYFSQCTQQMSNTNPMSIASMGDGTHERINMTEQDDVIDNMEMDDGIDMLD